MIYVVRLSDGSWMNWGRHGPAQWGGAFQYTGEAAKVLDLIFGVGKR